MRELLPAEPVLRREDVQKLAGRPGTYPVRTISTTTTTTITAAAGEGCAGTDLHQSYRDIAIATSSSSPSSGSGSPKGKKRSPAPRRSRLHLLHRTLIARPDLAGHIHTLTLPAVGPQSDVARLILLCPNLRRLSGPQSPFTPGRTDRVHAALATRTQLEEQLWYVTDGGGGRGGGGGGGPLQERWTGLRTLVLHGSNPWGQDARVLPAFAETLSALAGLRKLMVSSFGAFAFTDESLAGLPAGLTHLRLARLAGVTDAGVVAACGRTAQLTSLSLEEVGLSRLATVATLLDALPRLRRFALAQAVLPTTTTTTTPTTTTPVLLASDSLEHMLWSVPTLHQNHVSATAALSASIRAGRLPALRSLAAPADDGTLRAACAAAPAPLGRGLTCDWLGWRGSAALWRPSAHASDCGGGDGTNVAFVAERRTPDVDGIVVRAGADESSEPCCRGHRSASARAEVRLDALFG